MAVALGRKPISYKYYPDMSKHFILGTDKTPSSINTKHQDKYKAEAKWLPKGWYNYLEYLDSLLI